MGFNDGKIVLDSNTGAYNAGQTVNGKLIFTQDKVKTFRGIYVQVKGYAHVHWTTSHTRRVNDRSETYHVSHNAHEEYFRTKQYLIGSANGEHQLQPGQHVFPFTSHIPEQCPSSLEGSHGHVRYEIKIVVDRAFKIDQEKETTFQVVAHLDLNRFPDLREPLQMETVESYCCLCVSSGGSSTVVKVPRRGVVPGEVLPVEVSCQNNSSLTIERIRIRITKTTTYHAHENPATKSEESTIVEVKKGPVLAGSSKSWTADLEVPIMDVNYLAACQIINVQYYFEVKVSPSGCHEDSEEASEIHLGTIPFRPIEELAPQSEQIQLANQVNGPYPQAITSLPYPGGNLPYPGGNPPYTGGNSPYPAGMPANVGGNSPYPIGTMPYPAANVVNSVNPYGSPGWVAGNPPYPNVSPPYPGVNVPAPLPAGNPEAVPLLPYTNSAPQVNPYASASAPAIPAVVSAPDHQYPYNPHYISTDK